MLTLTLVLAGAGIIIIAVLAYAACVAAGYADEHDAMATATRNAQALADAQEEARHAEL